MEEHTGSGRRTHVGEVVITQTCWYGADARTVIGGADGVDRAVGGAWVQWATYRPHNAWAYAAVGPRGVGLLLGTALDGAWVTSYVEHQADHGLALSAGVVLPPPGRRGSPVRRSGATATGSALDGAGHDFLTTFGLLPDPAQALCVAGLGPTAGPETNWVDLVQMPGDDPFQVLMVIIRSRRGAAVACAERRLGRPEHDQSALTLAIDDLPWSVWVTCDWPGVGDIGITRQPGWWNFPG